MKRLLLFIAGVLCAFAGLEAQVPATALHPVSWYYHVEKLGNSLFELHITAVISPGWHLYARHQPENAIAFPTTIRFDKDSMVLFQGCPFERGRLEHFANPALDIAANQYTGSVEFIQVIKLLGKGPVQVTGDITYQTCRDAECLPPGVTRFSIRLPG